VRDEYAIPPLRDLPGDRLAERKRHLFAEIAQPSLRRRIPAPAALVPECRDDQTSPTLMSPSPAASG